MRIKKLLSTALAAALVIGSLTAPAAALSTSPAQSLTTLNNYSSKNSDRLYTYSTAALDAYNQVELTLSGNTLNIRRRAYRMPSGTDTIQVGQIAREATWEYTTGDSLPFGYDLSVDLSTLATGSYNIKIQSKDTYIYTAVNAGFTKAAGECYFPADKSPSKLYNYDVMRRLDSGSAPDDFTALVDMYSSDKSTLEKIQSKAKEVTRGKRSDRDKAMAITQWIAENVAYDFDMAGDNYYRWMKTHPEDEVRLDSPLNAFTQGYALCYGYARLTALMMGYAGVDCVYITGCLAEDQEGNINKQMDTTNLPDVMNHAWNAVKLDGSWYFVDTSNDALGTYHRTNPAAPSTGYVETTRSPIYQTTFPTLGELSKTHIAIRLGVKNKGTKLSAATVPNGWQENSFYVDGVQTKKDWMRIDGDVYYFNAKGAAVKGWQLVDDYWRFFDDEGVMVTGTLNVTEGDERLTYRFDSSGRVTASGDWVTFDGATRYYRGIDMMTGWQFLEGAWRYFDDTGALYNNERKELKQKGNTYRFTSDGELQVEGKGWVELEDNKLYFEGSDMYTGVCRIGGKDYFFDQQGIMQTGWQTQDEKTYYFDEDGVMQTGWMFLDDNWYYTDRVEGRYNGFQTVGGETHYFHPDGWLYTGGWVNVGTGRLYFADYKTYRGGPGGGTMVKGWKRVDDNLYYFDKETGLLHTGPDQMLNTNNNKWYVIDEKGVATKIGE